jgi:hypothetical protein
MAKQWNGTLATQTVHFRGTSAVSVLNTSTAQPNLRTLSSAAYCLQVTGGVSGSFGCHILGRVGGVTVITAGVTGVGAAGNYVLYPIGYSSTGAAAAVGAVGGLGDFHRVDQILPPQTVVFQSGIATAGISATLALHAALHEGC